MHTYLNANGLINGKIPKGRPCPFIDFCIYKTDNCPSKNKINEIDFSCAVARLLFLHKKVI